jgi:DNA-binding NarL/FixJ family response regulator
MKQKNQNGGTHSHRVFIVDDHPLVREGLANLINQQTDCAVCGEAEDSATAITGIGTSQPDVVLVDISLKNESGLELVKTLRNQFPDLAVIVLSMHEEALYAERALHAGARGYVMKRELEIFRLLGQGRTPSQIAEDLRLSLKTVQAYCARAKEKFGVTSLTELLRAAIRWEDAMHVK